ncbi:MAG: cupin domain-containing protein [Desulfobacterales bacterium]|nr:cupin domain-containing protein [Desulfobacterales bacterium]
MITSNIYLNIPEELPNELSEKIIYNKSFKLERIISKGHSTTKGQWYDQGKDEWVILLKGSAGIAIEGEASTVVLKPGDYIHLPAHLKHRVEWTDPATETVWLALHYEKGES